MGVAVPEVHRPAVTMLLEWSMANTPFFRALETVDPSRRPIVRHCAGVGLHIPFVRKVAGGPVGGPEADANTTKTDAKHGKNAILSP